jgi:subtilase family protein
MRTFALLLLALVTQAWAADFSGVWTGSMNARLPNGQQRQISLRMTLQQKGTDVAGRVGPSDQDSSAIQKGRVDVDVISFETRAGEMLFRFHLLAKADGSMSGTVETVGVEGEPGTVEMRRSGGGAPVTAAPAASSNVLAEVKPFDDVRVTGMRRDPEIRANLSGFGEQLWTLTFNQKTKWPEPALMPRSPRPSELLEAAMDPGLGIRGLHQQGITGKGVSVAIIDQPLYRDHPEFEGKIVAYEDVGCGTQSSMHGPAVASFLAGNRTGTAPGVRVYYAAAPSWTADTAYQAKALDWIVALNRKLPASERIRVVSVSAAPSGPGSPFKTNLGMWDEAVKRAEADGILVLDCTTHHGVIGACWRRGVDADNPASYAPGFAGVKGGAPATTVLAPTSPRTAAEQYRERDYGYAYFGRGGLSWAIPYAAGVLAMGWQVRPELTPKEMVGLLFQSAYRADGSTNIIQPVAFIHAVRERRR